MKQDNNERHPDLLTREEAMVLLGVRPTKFSEMKHTYGFIKRPGGYYFKGELEHVINTGRPVGKN